MRKLVKNGQYIPLDTLFAMDIRGSNDSREVSVFYVQSMSIVDFFFFIYGNQKFGQLCRNLRDGSDFETSLKNAYISTINSIDDLQSKWLQSMTN